MKIVYRIISIIAVVALSIFVYSIREEAHLYAIYGYPGNFLISLLAKATVLLPAPGIAIVFTMGAVFHPLGVGLAAGAGGAIGEISGYLAGFSGQVVIENTSLYTKMSSWMKKNGPLSILFFSIIPNPFFDLAGIAAGALKMPFYRFLFWAWIGITAKMIFFAYAGSSSIDIFSR
jgi:membrane protein DedA with SNARE-associated domain